MLPIVFTILIAAFEMASASSAEPKPLSEPQKAELKKLLMEAVKTGDATQVQYDATIRLVESFPCSGVSTLLTPERRSKLEKAISKQTGVAEVSVYKLMQFGEWSIVYSNAGVGDSPYMFYSTDPFAGATPVAVWSGGSPIYEAGDVANWATEHARGIPGSFGNCFAWDVILSPE